MTASTIPRINTTSRSSRAWTSGCTRCGGIRETRLICEAAEREGVVASPHNFSSGVGLAATLHLMAAVPEIQLLEYDSSATAIYEELFVEPLAVKDGRVRVPTGPGLGVALTDAIIAKYR